MQQITINLPTATVMKVAVIVFLALWVGNALALALHHGLDIDDGWGLVTLLHFDREQNLPTLFSVQLILGSSALACARGMATTPETVKRSGWCLVALILLLLAVDEFASIHERVDSAIRYYLGEDNLPYVVWPIPYVAGVLIVGSVLGRWFFALPRSLALGFALAGVIYLSGAVGIELIAGTYIAEIDPDHLGVSDLKRDLFATVEESLEMIGLLLLFRLMAGADS